MAPLERGAPDFALYNVSWIPSEVPLNLPEEGLSLKYVQKQYKGKTCVV